MRHPAAGAKATCVDVELRQTMTSATGWRASENCTAILVALAFSISAAPTASGHPTGRYGSEMTIGNTVDCARCDHGEDAAEDEGDASETTRLPTAPDTSELATNPAAMVRLSWPGEHAVASVIVQTSGLPTHATLDAAMTASNAVATVVAGLATPAPEKEAGNETTRVELGG